MKSIRTIMALLVVPLALGLVSCGGRAETEPADTPGFEIDLSQLGDAYESDLAPVSFRPPVNWRLLEGEQRKAVLEALAGSEEVDEYSLSVVDIFFDTESLSFLSLALVSGAEAPAVMEEFVSSFSQALGLEPGTDASSQLVARMDFIVNDVSIVQFRHLRENQVLQENRITFTLVFEGPARELIRLDYSIPSEEYQRESVKLESSIGTIQLQNTGT